MWWCCSGHARELPAEARQLAGDGDGDLGALDAAVAVEVAPALVEASLAAPGQIDDRRVVAGLAAAELLRDARRLAVVPGGFDEQPAGVLGAGLGDRALAAARSGGLLGRDEAEVGGQLLGMREAVDVARVCPTKCVWSW